MNDRPDPLLPREALLAAAARAVLAAFREPLEQRSLSSPAMASLRLLESALDPYFDRGNDPLRSPARNEDIG